MKLKEIHDEQAKIRGELRQKINDLKEEEVIILQNKLKELGLDGMVVYKGNGHIGKLKINVTRWDWLEFHPLTKKGEVSKRIEYHWDDKKDVEDMYEPYKGGEND